MTTRQRQIAVGFTTLVIGLLIIWGVVSVQPKPVKQTWQPPATPYIPNKSGPGIGETAGYGYLSLEEKARLRSAASQAGITEQEMEKLRVQTMHQGMYPEDAVGGMNDRERQREQSRKASGFYDTQPRR